MINKNKLFTYGDFKSKYYYRFTEHRTINDSVKIFDRFLNKVLKFDIEFDRMTPYSIMDKYLSNYLISERDKKLENLLND